MKEDWVTSDASITLGEAMSKMQASEAEDFASRTSAELERLAEQHDAVHVLFGCGTSIRDEIAAHVWMLFATTANLCAMHQAVASQEHRRVASRIGYMTLGRVWLSSLPRIISIIFKSLRMKKRIVMEDIVRLKTLTVAEIRQEHGIIL